MPSQLYSNDFGFGRAATGGDASRQVSASSSFGPQGVRQSDYASLAKQLDDYIVHAKSLSAILHQRAGGSDAFDTSTTIGQINHCLKKARIAVSKGEAAADEDGDATDATDAASAIENASKLLKRAKALLVDAVESEDEDESAVEAAKASYLKVSKRLASLQKAKPAPVAAAPTAISAKAVAALDAQTNVLKAQLNEVIEMLGSRSRSAGAPPNFSVAKASNDAEPSLHAQIAHLRDIGSIDANTAISAKSLASRVALAKSGQGDIAEVKEMISRAGSEVIRNLFAGI